MSANRRLPIGLTIAVAISLVILIVLGTWQVQRLHWKTKVLADIAAAQTAAPVPFDDILRLKAAGQAVEWRKVKLDCQSATTGSPVILYSLVGGEIAWRLVSPCRLPGGETIALERGVLHFMDGVVEPEKIPVMPAPQSVVGIVRLAAPASSLAPSAPEKAPGGFRVRARDSAALAAATGPGGMGDVYVSVVSETPGVPDLEPAPTPPDIPNRHLEYALTWYGLAGALLAIYGAMLGRRFKAP
jgi:surfeit locus 1 family protein